MKKKKELYIQAAAAAGTAAVLVLVGLRAKVYRTELFV